MTFQVAVPALADAPIRVRACARGFEPQAWEPIGPVDVAGAASGGAPLVVEAAGRVRLASPSPCVDYVVRPRAREGAFAAVATDAAFFGGHGSVFLRPTPRPASVPVEVRFDAPEGVEVSAAWPTINGVGRPDATFFDRESHLAFGAALAVRSFERAGTQVERARLPGALAVTDDTLDRWLGDAIDAVAAVVGRFPRERVQLVVIPVPPGGEPVAFGLVRRGGGASVMLLVRADADLEALESGWVAVHELSHLVFPLVDRRDAWLSEGLATYYQEVLKARAGQTDARRAFERLEAGFERGRRLPSDRPLAMESAQMRETHRFQRVYWSGAAFALIADVALRQRGTSLDALVAARGSELWAPRGRWSARALLGALERPLEGPLLTSLAARLEASAAFPDLGPTYDALGIAVRDDGSLAFSDAPEARALRDAIMSPRRDP